MTMRVMRVLGAAALAIFGAANAEAEEAPKTAAIHTVVARILVCPRTIAPADCDATNALDVIAGPPSTSESGCGVLSQQMLGVAGIAISDGQYIKIGCVRREARTD